MEMDDGKEWKMMQKDAKSKKTWNMFEDILALCEEIFFLRSNSTPFCLNKVTIPSMWCFAIQGFRWILRNIHGP